MGKDTANLRTIRRMRAYKGARFILDRRTGGGVDCRIVDIHSRGARLRFDAPVTCRSTDAEIMIFPENKRVAGRIAWRKGLELGMEFERPLEWMARHDVALEVAASAA